jgi:osmotically-inducible protein OsmY
MKKIIALTFTLLLTATVAFAQGAAQPEKKKPEMKKEKAMKAPKSDADVQKCITDKFTGSKTLTGGAATVASGEATLSGEAKNAGAKTSAGKTAQSCGAKKVTNNITIMAPEKPAAKPMKGEAKPMKK